MITGIAPSRIDALLIAAPNALRSTSYDHDFVHWLQIHALLPDHLRRKGIITREG
jgi:hypothetical protein